MGTAPKNVNGSNDDTKMKMKSEKKRRKCAWMITAGKPNEPILKTLQEPT